MENTPFEHEKFQWGTWNSNYSRNKTTVGKQKTAGIGSKKCVIYCFLFFFTFYLWEGNEEKRWEEKVQLVRHVKDTYSVIDNGHSPQYPGYHRMWKNSLNLSYYILDILYLRLYYLISIKNIKQAKKNQASKEEWYFGFWDETNSNHKNQEWSKVFIPYYWCHNFF